MATGINWDNIISRIVNSVNEQLDKAIPEFLDRIKEQLTIKYAESMQEFYDVYTPKKYHRRGSLYDLLDIKIENNGRHSNIEISFSDFIADNDGTDLLPIVFEGGFHGGREPNYTYWGHAPVFRSTSPMELYTNEINKYAIYAAQFDFEAVWEKYAKNIQF